MQRHNFLKILHNINETLFYNLVTNNLKEMLNIIYTPNISHAVLNYSENFLFPRGLYISYPDRNKIKKILNNRTNFDIDIIVVSDAESILGIGDQGIAGIEIPIAKLMIYTLLSGINPFKCLPIILDVGTNNPLLMNNYNYLGWKNKRIKDHLYDEMIEMFINSINSEIPNTFLHWEDFGPRNSRKNLIKYKDSICSFNDDMQGTAAVTIAGLITATKKAKINFQDQKIIIFGSGTAGIGIADEIVKCFCRFGMNKKQAYSHLWCIDKNGLLIKDQQDMMDFQKPYACTLESVKNWKRNKNGHITLLEVVKKTKATTLIGCSSVYNAFNDEIILEMASNNKYPIIFPLSNPITCCERHPKDIIKLTNGKSFVATGSPFSDFFYNKKLYKISQSNNALVFPGIGLGIVAMKAKKLTDNMLWKACQTLADYSIQYDEDDLLLPPLNEMYDVSKKIAVSVALQAIIDGVTEYKPMKNNDIEKKIDDIIWKPKYYPYYK